LMWGWLPVVVVAAVRAGCFIVFDDWSERARVD
jgi:hypothetical protein